MFSFFPSSKYFMQIDGLSVIFNSFQNTRNSDETIQRAVVMLVSV